MDPKDRTKDRRKDRTSGEADAASVSSGALLAGLDALIWQTFASVLLPGALINQLVKLTTSMVEGQLKLQNDTTKNYRPTATSTGTGTDRNPITTTTGTTTRCPDATHTSKDITTTSTTKPARAGTTRTATTFPAGSGSTSIDTIGSSSSSAVQVKLLPKFFSPKNLRFYLPTAVGLLSIPLIIHPIDTFVDFAMDNSIRCTPFWTQRA